MDRDYIVAFDENGQPYIAHAWGKGTAHKYIEKWGEGAKARYFYTKQELEAALGRGKEAVSRATDKVRSGVREVSGAAARDRMKAAENDQRRAHGVSNADYAAYRSARRASMAADRRAVQAHGAHGNAIATSRSARQASIDARARATDSRTAYEKSEAAYREAYDKYYGDENNLGKTALRALSGRERERHAADKERLEQLDSERKAGYQDQASARSAVDRATDAERRAMSERRMAEREADKAERDSGVASDKLGAANLKVLESDVASMEAEQAYRRARAEYSRTPLGRIEAARDSAASWIKNAEETIKDYGNTAISDIKEVVSKVTDKIKGTEKSTVSTEKESPSSSPAERIWERKRAAAEKALEDAYTRLNAAGKADMFKLGDERHDGRTVYGLKRGRAAGAYRDATASLSNASSIDDARRAASEKRMAEKENRHDRVYGDKWDKAYDEWKAAQAEYKRIMNEDPNASRKK